MTTISEPILIVGAGGIGTKLAPEAASRLGASHITVSNIPSDLGPDSSLELSTAPIINPTVHVIRAAALRESSRILEATKNAKTIIIIANLAGRSGAGIAPIVAAICKNTGKKVISFAIMPFKYEKDRIFSSGIALKRLREASNCSVVIDNDAVLEGNPNLSVKCCHDMSNSAIMHVIGSIITTEIPNGNSIVSMSNSETSLEHSLVDAIKMLYENASSGSVSRSLLYVMGDNVPVGAINNMADTVSRLTENSATVVASGNGNEGVIMLSEISGAAKFDSYDPLGMIPIEKTLDWQEAESSISISLKLEQLEK